MPISGRNGSEFLAKPGLADRHKPEPDPQAQMNYLYVGHQQIPSRLTSFQNIHMVFYDSTVVQNKSRFTSGVRMTIYLTSFHLYLLIFLIFAQTRLILSFCENGCP